MRPSSININKYNLSVGNENTEFFREEKPMKQDTLFLAMCFTLGVLIAVCIIVTVFLISR